MKLVVITDVHANLPALEATLGQIRDEGYDVLVHLGDAIGIGPQPAECLELLLDTPGIRFVRGNHDDWFARGLPRPQPEWMSDGEVAHQEWTHAQIDPGLRPVVGDWPWVIEQELAGVYVTFAHYPLDPSHSKFQSFVQDPSGADLDRLFANHRGRLAFFGHDHNFYDVQGRARYVNPGSLGCHDKPLSRYTAVEMASGRYEVAHRAVRYDDGPLYTAFEERKVPERAFIYRNFLGERFPP